MALIDAVQYRPELVDAEACFDTADRKPANLPRYNCQSI